MTFYADSDESDTTKSPQKKRGRKNTESSKYLIKTERKIAAWKNELAGGLNEKGDNFTEKEKQKLRNRISAMSHRANKKFELENLQR